MFKLKVSMSDIVTSDVFTYVDNALVLKYVLLAVSYGILISIAFACLPFQVSITLVILCMWLGIIYIAYRYEKEYEKFRYLMENDTSKLINTISFVPKFFEEDIVFIVIKLLSIEGKNILYHFCGKDLVIRYEGNNLLIPMDLCSIDVKDGEMNICLCKCETA